MLWTPEERWDRMAQGLFWTGWLFVAFTAYGVYSGDDWRGVVMTLVPGAIVFALWYMARARADHLADGTKMPLPAKAVAAAVVLVGVAFVIHTIRMAPHLQIVTADDRAAEARRSEQDRYQDLMKNVEIVDGTLQRKRPKPERECEDWGSVPDPTKGHEGEVVEFCKRWVPEPK